MHRQLMRLAVARSWGVVLSCSSRVIEGQIREPKHLVCLLLIVVEIKVSEHLLCLLLQLLLFRVLLSCSQLLQPLPPIRVYGLIYQRCRGRFKEEKELNAKRHVDLLALLQALQPKPPAP